MHNPEHFRRCPREKNGRPSVLDLALQNGENIISKIYKNSQNSIKKGTIQLNNGQMI